MPYVTFYKNSEIEGTVYMAGSSAEIGADAAEYLISIDAAALATKPTAFLVAGGAPTKEQYDAAHKKPTGAGKE